MRSLAERANLLATPSGFWKRELLGAKPIAVCPLRDPSRTRPRSLTSDGCSEVVRRTKFSTRSRSRLLGSFTRSVMVNALVLSDVANFRVARQPEVMRLLGGLCGLAQLLGVPAISAQAGAFDLHLFHNPRCDI